MAARPQKDMEETMDVYRELEKQEQAEAASPDLLRDIRYSMESDEDLHELDPLNHNGNLLNGTGEHAGYAQRTLWNGAIPAWRDERWHEVKTRSHAFRSYMEQYIPVSKIEESAVVRRMKRLIPTARIRRMRRQLGLTVPGRIMGFTASLLAIITVLVIIPGGTYVYNKGTTNGQSPAWYPAPVGGTMEAWKDSYEKAAHMVARMSLAEKVNVTTGTGWMMGMCVGNTGPATIVGFPSLCLQDGPLGLRFADHITANPAGITVGATWNKELMYKRGKLLGVEARMKGVNVLLGPSVGPLGRSPAGGRNWEGFGSDPVLQGIAGAETIRGIQEEGVIATIKHFVGNEQEHYRQSYEWGLPNAISSNIDDRTLHELYAWPFADAVRAGVGSAMCSYNQVNNSYACQNSKLLNGILKDELGFQGFVQSDWLAQRSGVASAQAGLDMSMPGDGARWMDGASFWGPHLSRAVLNGTIPLRRLNDMATRVVAAWYQMKQDDTERWKDGPNFSSWTNDEEGLLHPGSNDKTTGTVNQFVDAASGGSYSHRSLARKVAAEGIVLLKNDAHLLPLGRDGWSQSDMSSKDPEIVRIAVVGEDSTQAEGGPNVCPDRGCNKGSLAMGWGSGAVEMPYLVTPLEALRSAFHEDKVDVVSFPSNKLPYSTNGNATSIEEMDFCIVFVNADGGEGFIAADGISGDRNDLDIQKNGNALIADVAARCGTQNPRSAHLEKGDRLASTIVVVHAVGPVLVESFIETPNVHAILLANLPGQESGNALVDVLLGDVNPSGHLPYTMAKSLEDYGPAGEIMFYPNGIVPQQTFDEGLLIDYRHFDANNIEPRFAFGHGLSYAEFILKDLVISPTNSDQRPDLLPPPRPADQTSPPDHRVKLPGFQESIWPKNFRRLKKYIYPYLSERDVLAMKPIEDVREEPHEHSQAGGGEGGHPALYETVATVDITVVNTGGRDGQAVVQLYIGFPSDVHETEEGSDVQERIDFPVRVLRGFEKVFTYSRRAQIAASPKALGEQGDKGEDEGEDSDYASKTVRFVLTRRDLSYWSVRKQNWVLPKGEFTLEVGWSSRDLPARGSLF